MMSMSQWLYNISCFRQVITVQTCPIFLVFAAELVFLSLSKLKEHEGASFFERLLKTCCFGS
jgi:hypothetical protein